MENGTLDLIAGPMYSGKTTEILRRLNNESQVGFRVLYINHMLDERDERIFSSHNPLHERSLLKDTQIDGEKTSCLLVVEEKCKEYDVIGIDEAQFFDDLYEVVKRLVDEDRKHVIVAGLNGDSNRKEFGSILKLEPISDSYTKLTSYCKRCAQTRRKTSAPFTYRISNVKDQILVGSSEFIPVCRKCYLELTLYNNDQQE